MRKPAEVIKELLAKFDEVDQLLNDKDRFRVWTRSNCGIYSASQKGLVVPQEYHFIDQLDADKFQVSHGGRLYGVFSVSAGRLVVPMTYHHVDSFDWDKLLVRRDGLCGVYSMTLRKLVVLMKYTAITQLNQEKFLVRSRRHCGVYSSSSGKLLVPVKYEHIELRDGELHLFQGGGCVEKIPISDLK